MIVHHALYYLRSRLAAAAKRFFPKFSKHEVSMTYDLSSGVAIPTPARGSRPSKYPFATMAVGEMFCVVDAPKAFAGQVSAAGRRLGRKFVTRRVTLTDSPNGLVLVQDGETPTGPTYTGVGVWRVADDAVLRKPKQ